MKCGHFIFGNFVIFDLSLDGIPRPSGSVREIKLSVTLSKSLVNLHANLIN